MEKFVWKPKDLVKCCMCSSNFGHTYKIVTHGIWWDDDTRTAYVNYDFCSICFTILGNLWPNETILASSSKKLFYESGLRDLRDRFNYIIKNNPLMDAEFNRARDEYILKISS